LDDGDILVVSNVVHQTGTYRCEEGWTSSSNFQGRPRFGCLPHTPGPRNWGDAWKAVRPSCIVAPAYSENLLRKVLTDSPDQIPVEICRLQQQDRDTYSQINWLDVSRSFIWLESVHSLSSEVHQSLCTGTTITRKSSYTSPTWNSV